MNFSIKLFAVALLIFSHQTFSMDMKKHETRCVEARCVLDPFQGERRAESSDGMWRVQTSKHGELLCKKNVRGQFEVRCVLTGFKTRMIIPIKSKVPNRHRFLLRMTHGPFIDVIDTHTSAIRFLAKPDAELLHQIPVDLKSAYMSHDSAFIGVQDSWFNTTRVTNPLPKQIRILKK